MKRTVLIANTSDMPVAAREASIYTGITIAEYFRDMGYDVAVIADSTSRWAEALREMSGRLEEMPGEEGYPAYLPPAWPSSTSGPAAWPASAPRTAGAASPPWAPCRLRAATCPSPWPRPPCGLSRCSGPWIPLAYKRHFPAINWLNSYSLYLDSLKPWFDENLGPEFLEDRAKAMSILQEEASLNEIVQLVGKDALSPADQLTLEVAKMVREDFLQQNAFVDVDCFSSYDRQEKLLAMILDYDRLCREAIARRARRWRSCSPSPSREKIGRAKSVPADDEYQQVYPADLRGDGAGDRPPLRGRRRGRMIREYRP